MATLPEIEQQPISVQQQFQAAQLKLTLEYLQLHSPFYQRLFATHAVQPGTIRSLDDLVRLPTTSKEDLQRYNMDFLCVPPAAVQEYVATSGTLGYPVTIALTAKDLQRLAYNEYLSFGCLEAGPDDIFQLMLTLDRQFMAGIAYYTGLLQAGPAIVRTGPGLVAMQWDTLQRLGTTGLVGVPSFLLKMTAYAQQQQIDCSATTVRKVLAIGESLRDDNLEPNALAKKIQEAWPLQLYSTYAATEMQTAFTECTAGKGGHHHPELIIVELLDDGHEVRMLTCSNNVAPNTKFFSFPEKIEANSGSIEGRYTDGSKYPLLVDNGEDLGVFDPGKVDFKNLAGYNTNPFGVVFPYDVIINLWLTNE